MKEDFNLIVRNLRYEMALSEGDEGIIELLDLWLENFLFSKSRCPVCGEIENE